MYINGHSIAESLMPTYENVVREFVTDSMYNLIFNKEMHNFNFLFLEKEAIDYIEKFLIDYVKENNYYLKYSKRIMKALKEPKSLNKTSTLIIKDYKYFFELLRCYYEKDIELYFNRIEVSGFPVYEKKNCFEQIWLRATIADFNNPEKFLEKQVKMIYDNTFERFDEETYLGIASFIDNNVLCVKNGIARTWDENIREFEIKIYDKETYDFYNPYLPFYACPVVRYGVYEKNGKKICQIGAVQNIQKKDEPLRAKKLAEIFKKQRYKLNKGIIDENLLEVEPAAVFSLSVFINFLHQEGITLIEVPANYVLDYDYHVKSDLLNISSFNKLWNLERRNNDPEGYKRDKLKLENSINKVDLIIKNKTERFKKTFYRILYHYPNSKMLNSVDNNMIIEIPIVNSTLEINNDILKEMYMIIKQYYFDQNSSFSKKLV